MFVFVKAPKCNKLLIGRAKVPALSNLMGFWWDILKMIMIIMIMMMILIIMITVMIPKISFSSLTVLSCL